MMFSVTYDVVTEASAIDGDTADSGFYHRGGWRTDVDDRSQWTLREIVSTFGRGSFEDGGRSFYSADSDTDYRSGDATSYAVHPPENITRSSYARVRRILCGR